VLICIFNTIHLILAPKGCKAVSFSYQINILLLISHFCFVEREVKLSPALEAANRQSAASGDVSTSPSKLVAVASPQRRPQSEKKVYKHISVKLVISSEWNCLGVSHSAEMFAGWVCFYTVAIP
jgi:hypothetical protein